MARGLNKPHILLASKNVMTMIENLNHLLNQTEVDKLTHEIDRNVSALFVLGKSHFDFAAPLTERDWRQKISRFYYGVYNVRRAVALKYSGTYSIDVSDHKNVDQLPDDFLNRESHIDNLKTLREDRNLADYSHLATMSDLIVSPIDAQGFATRFIADSRTFLHQRSVRV